MIFSAGKGKIKQKDGSVSFEVESINPGLPFIEAKTNKIDYVFILEENTLLHLEFQSTLRKDALLRIMLYNARLLKIG